MERIYDKFKLHERYERVFRDRVKMYNKMSPNDFDWMALIGEGGYGKVMRVRKKSTRKHYAMKVQSKAKILESGEKNANTIRMERDVLTESNSKHICPVYYAFQDDEYVFLVLELALGGDVHHVADVAPNKRLSEDIVRFWTAEIFCGLMVSVWLILFLLKQ